MKTRLRLQLMIGLLFLAMTISMIAVSFAWFSASPGEVKVSGSNVSITTAENDYKINVKYTLLGQVESISDMGICTVSTAQSYIGQEGINDKYMLLFEISGTEAMTLDAYVSACTLDIPTANNKFSYDKENTPFTITFVKLNENKNYEIVLYPTEVTSYVIITFGNGKDIFPYSDRAYMGTTFKLEISLVAGDDNE